MAQDFPFTKQEFDAIYGKVPRLCVEVLVSGPEGVYLTKRDIEPCKGQWHLPGGTVYYGESLLQAVKRVGQRELGIEVKTAEQKGIIEYPSHYLHLGDHPVGVVFLVTRFSGDIGANSEAQEGAWFKTIPDEVHGDQDTYLVEQGFLKPRT